MTASPATYRHAGETPGFADRVAGAKAVLRRAAREHARRIVQASSLGAEDQVLTDMITRLGLPIAVATLDTALLHAETLALAEETQRRYGIAIERWRPEASAVVAFVSRHGEHAMRRSVELRRSCCHLRKVEPLARLLDGRTAWLTGLRREQSADRAGVAFEARDEQGRVKISPLADWSSADVWHYIDRYAVPYSALHDEGYPSIGCRPCTRAVGPGEDPRAGRWWWEQVEKKECGLHDRPPGAGAGGAAT